MRLVPGLVRFVPKSDSSAILVGQPEDDSVDVGKALYEGKDVSVTVFDGKSVLSAGDPTDKTASIEKVLSPLTQGEVGTIRCLGLNVSSISDVAPNICEGRPEAIIDPDDRRLISDSTKPTPTKPKWSTQKFLPSF